MANNRMYIECNCGKNIMIAKHFGSPWTIRADEKQMDDFLEKHFRCVVIAKPGEFDSLAQGSHFRLTYEHTDDRPDEDKL